MNRDPLDILTQLRPTDTAIDARWAPADRAAVLEDIVGSRRRSHRRRTALVGAASIAAAAAIVAVLPGGSPDRGPSPTHAPPVKLAAVTMALHRLATVAAVAPNDVGDGRYWHMTVSEHQTDTPGQADITSTLEGWTDQDGRLWRHDVHDGGGTSTNEYFQFSPGSSDVSYPSPAYLRTLPTGKDALYAFLDAHVSGSNSHEEAIFVAIGDMLRGGFAPPELRVAAIQVLGELPHVSLGDATTDVRGRTVQEFDFVDESIRPGEVQALYFDPQTAQIIDESETAPDLQFTSTVVQADTVDQIPADVLAKAVLQHD